MSTPLYIKETKLEDISNSRISEGCALLFYLDGKLKMKFSDGSVSDATGGSNIERFVISRPIYDKKLYPRLEASATSDFLNPIVIDTLNNEADRQYVQVFNGNEWLKFPEDGLGTPFDRSEVAININKFSSLPQPYFIRYCWVESDGTESNFRSSLFPSTSIGSSNSVGQSNFDVTIGDNGNWYINGEDTGKKATGQGSNVVLSPTPPSNSYDGMIWIQTESAQDNQYVNFEKIDVVIGSEQPEDAPDGTIFIQE